MAFTKTPSAPTSRSAAPPPPPPTTTRTFNATPAAPAATPPPRPPPRQVDTKAPPVVPAPVTGRDDKQGGTGPNLPPPRGFTVSNPGAAATPPGPQPGVQPGQRGFTVSPNTATAQPRPNVDAAGRIVTPPRQGGFTVSQPATPAARAAEVQAQAASVRAVAPTNAIDASANLGARMRFGRAQAQATELPASAQPLPARATRSQLQSDLQRSQAQRDQARADLQAERNRAAADYSRNFQSDWNDRYRTTIYVHHDYNAVTINDVIYQSWLINAQAAAIAAASRPPVIYMPGGGQVVGTAAMYPQQPVVVGGPGLPPDEMAAIRDMTNARAGDISDQYHSLLRKLDDAARAKDVDQFNQVWENGQMLIQLVVAGSADASGRPQAIGGRPDLAPEHVRAELAGTVKSMYNGIISTGYDNALARKRMADAAYIAGKFDEGDQHSAEAVRIVEGLRPIRDEGEDKLAAINCDDDLLVNVDREAEIRSGSQEARIKGSEAQLQSMLASFPQGKDATARAITGLADRFNAALTSEHDIIGNLRATPIEGFNIDERQEHAKRLLTEFYTRAFERLYAYGESTKSKVQAAAQQLAAQAQAQAAAFGVTGNFGRNEAREKDIDSKASALSLSL